ncbi:uncharacterized protein K460DRAFT_35172 [Cucurbitaria berberidis CBS 394.84]|uniref:Uncharacterized protein n=1 Tax=Cucurbitaria berberidis CBS 394.84 TaxID=1168544 RepID=A0A9P4GRP1_9PLEO|nr:uncharacterized protein K460DRAFT_35172 [Cucurbitaria berberidis CBS 394.84]KAF1851463.1 hypothetical protein K460DRAFT_35172 [Cucurbitaria berberidis CBS 394.84]
MAMKSPMEPVERFAVFGCVPSWHRSIAAACTEDCVGAPVDCRAVGCLLALCVEHPQLLRQGQDWQPFLGTGLPYLIGTKAERHTGYTVGGDVLVQLGLDDPASFSVEHRDSRRHAPSASSWEGAGDGGVA